MQNPVRLRPAGFLKILLNNQREGQTYITNGIRENWLKKHPIEIAEGRVLYCLMPYSVAQFA